jgi:hypothetical protein
VSLTLPSHSVVRAARVRDWSYIEHLSNHFSYELGFIPKIAFINRIEGRRGGGVLLNVVDKQSGGFLHYGTMRDGGECRIFQSAIDYQLQRQHHGLSLVNEFVEQADAAGVRLITCRCLITLDANRFWRAAGFQQVGVEQGARGRLAVYAKRLQMNEDLLAGIQPPLITFRTQTCKACGKSTTYTRGPKGELWKLCAACVSKASACVRKRA